MNGVFSKFMIHDLVYNGKSTVNERDCEDFLNMFKKYKILKLNQLVKQIKSRCSLYNHCFYKSAPGCMFHQFDMDCETHIRVKSGIDWKCYKQHRMICKYSKSKSGFVLGI